MWYRLESNQGTLTTEAVIAFLKQNLYAIYCCQLYLLQRIFIKIMSCFPITAQYFRFLCLHFSSVSSTSDAPICTVPILLMVRNEEKSTRAEWTPVVFVILPKIHDGLSIYSNIISGAYILRLRDMPQHKCDFQNHKM
jgi:hypothetical protein